jgi:hypothetical protein
MSFNEFKRTGRKIEVNVLLPGEDAYTYYVNDPTECENSVDANAARLAVEHDDMITLGCIMAIPLD